MISRLLRLYVRLVCEDAMKTEDAASEGLALFSLDEDDDKKLILYDPVSFSDVIYSLVYFKNHREPGQKYSDDEADNTIVGYINYGPYYGLGEAYGSDVVHLTAARKDGGYGPIMYDLAMEDSGMLMPDRRLVSSFAEKIWNYYFYKRDDVKKKKLDNVHKPETETKVDDAEVFSDVKEDPVSGETVYTREREPLNYVYQPKRKSPGLNELKDEHEHTMKRMRTKFKIDQSEIEKILVGLAGHFFDKRYEDYLRTLDLDTEDEK